MLSGRMNILDITINQLKRAAVIKEQIEGLNKELGSILGVSGKSGASRKKNRTMSASARKNIAAAQKARWARVQAVKPATQSVKPAAKVKKKRISAATRAKLSAKLKAFWAAKRAGKK